MHVDISSIASCNRRAFQVNWFNWLNWCLTGSVCLKFYQKSAKRNSNALGLSGGLGLFAADDFSINQREFVARTLDLGFIRPTL